MKKLWWIGVFLAGLMLGLYFGAPESRPAVTQAEPEGTALRYTNLVCRELVRCEGTEQTDAVAAVFENTGNYAVEYARVVMIRGGRRLTFEIHDLSPGDAVLSVEENGAAYNDDPVERCYCLTMIPAGQRTDP